MTRQPVSAYHVCAGCRNSFGRKSYSRFTVIKMYCSIIIIIIIISMFFQVVIGHNTITSFPMISSILLLTSPVLLEELVIEHLPGDGAAVLHV